MRYKEFRFEGYRYDRVGNTLSLAYRFLDGPRFEEVLSFDFPPRALSHAEEAVLDRIFRLVFLFAGVSYYKAFVPENLICEPFALDRVTAEFVQKFYENGLAEFAWKNGLRLAGYCHVAARDAAPSAPLALDLPRRVCVPIGGGKDSIVTVECLKAAGEEVVLFALGDATPIAASIAAAGRPAIRVRRRLDPGLFRLNADGAFNGHVPVTGILSAIVLACAVLAGFDTIAMSNEHSASAPNLIVDGAAINHQYSKSLEFERDFADYIARHITPSIAYFSLLRPLSEIEIARRFSRHPRYFDLFHSCNAAFRQSPDHRQQQWCGHCPKCRFVFLALAPFVAKDRLIAVFGRNLLDDEAQLAGFAELCGVRAHKPFECVGETGESAVAMAWLATRAEWRDDLVVRRLGEHLPVTAASDPAASLHSLLEKRHPHRVPARFLAMLDACG